ncbi:pentapeptide repeat-containing protein [Streptomyces sp. NPDC059272]|uniref:pentapeptide repeat-containing protein n=1 Tax=Streptomyces sp. NPDC059272 TaxID=3346800 RepID=UPI0036B69D16
MEAAQLRELVIADRPPGAGPLTVRGARVRGVLDLTGCRVDGTLEFLECHFDEPVRMEALAAGAVDLSGSTLPALLADRISVDGELRLAHVRLGDGTAHHRPLLDPREGEGHGRSPRRVREGHSSATVHLADARIGGSLVVEHLAVTDSAAWSVLAARLTVGGSIRGRGLTTSGSLYLRDARITHAVDLVEADVGGVDATGLVSGGGFYADWGFRSTGQVLLRAAEIGGVVTFYDSVLAQPAGALLLSRLRVSRLRIDLREPPSGRVVLQDAAVDVLVDDERTWPAAGALFIEGLTYKRIESEQPVQVRSRIAWLVRDPAAGAGSFEQLAKSYETVGDEGAARVVRHARERHLRRREPLLSRIWGYVQDVLFGYGYAPRRALAWLLLLVALGALWFAEHPPRPAGPRAGRAWDPVLYSLDLLIPVANLGYRTSWQAEGMGKAVALFLIVSGWTLATAVLAGARRALGRT